MGPRQRPGRQASETPRTRHKSACQSVAVPEEKRAASTRANPFGMVKPLRSIPHTRPTFPPPPPPIRASSQKTPETQVVCHVGGDNGLLACITHAIVLAQRPVVYSTVQQHDSSTTNLYTNYMKQCNYVFHSLYVRLLDYWCLLCYIKVTSRGSLVTRVYAALSAAHVSPGA